MATKIPSTFKKLVVQKVTTNFREAIEVIACPILTPGPGQLLVKNQYLGINASDINVTAARYFPGTKPPFDCGLEAVGEIVSIGEDCKRSSVGQSVGYVQSGAFSEYVLVNEKAAFPLPSSKAEYLPLLVSGLTAAISLDKVADLKASDTVLITAAAGGTGQFALQWAKNVGCHVIGLCSTDDKVSRLKSLGCDRAINSSKENLKEVLKVEYPNGVDVVYETIGGEVFETCVTNLALKGRIVLIGFISGYEGAGVSPLTMDAGTLMTRLLTRSQSIRGFMLMNFASDYAEYGMKLIRMLDSGKLKSFVDMGTKNPGGTFRGIDAVVDAVEYLYSRKSVGKIVVDCTGLSSSL